MTGSALEAAERAVALQPGDAGLWYRLGVARLDSGLLAQSEACWRKVLALDPRHAKASVNLGLVLQHAGKGDEALQCYRDAVAADPALAQAWFNLGTLLLARGQPGDALDCFRKALALEPGQAEWHAALGWALKQTGDAEAALAAFRQAHALAPDSQAAASNLLHALNFAAGESAERIFEEHCAWARRQFPAQRIAPHENAPEPARKLRIGYLAPDFNDPELAGLIEPVLEHHQRGTFEAVCYSDADAESGDAWRLRTTAALWHATAQLSNEHLAERIREDRIDILVDLAGHSAGGKRMALFAMKPAPLQFSLFGYPCSTGLETIVRLPGGRWCFKPPPEAPQPGMQPCAGNGWITFGSMRDLSALSRHSIALWARVLRALPDARLLIAARAAPSLAASMGERFRQEGVDPQRILLREPGPASAPFAFYAQVDIGLDVFPCAGIVTTLESLWMGVPVVTRSGDTEASKSGASILAALGMDELVARSDEDYERIAVSLARDPARLAALRRDLRPRMERSPLTDGRKYVAELEGQYRTAWQQWCARNSGRRAPARQIPAQAAAGAVPRVVLDGVFFQDYATGIARVWRSLLQEWARSGFVENILLLDRAGTAPKIPGLRLRAVPRHDYGRLEEDRAMLQAVCDEERATVFTSTYYSTPLATPVVMTVYDMIPEVLGMDLNEPGWREKAHCIGRAARFVAISRSTARDLHRVHPEVQPERITVAHVGVDPVFRPAGVEQIEDFKHRHRIGKPYYLFVGSRPNYKNASAFFRAFATLPDRLHYSVLCVGQPAELNAEEKAACEGTEARVLFGLSDEELRLAYGGAQALVYPSVYEGFGMPVIEAMASGCPVITTSHSSLPEAAGDAAIFVNPRDHLSLAAAMSQIRKPELRARLVGAGLDRAKLFSWTTMARSVAAVLAGV